MAAQTREVAVEKGERKMDLEYILEMESAEVSDRFDV